jgi:hypothetical protein
MSYIPKNSRFLALLFVTFLGCKKFVEVKPPITQLVTASVFNNAGSATSAQTFIYSKMNSNTESYNLEHNNGLLADELATYSSGTNLLYYQDRMSVQVAPDWGPWSNIYSYIYDCNAIVEALQNSNAITPLISQQLVGECKFVRAFWYFYLVNLYGDVPLVTTTHYETNANIARTPRIQVYQQIIADLVEAKSLLNNNYVDASDTAITTDRVRPNKATAAAMLARTYLYLGKYDSAEMQATSVISNPLYNLTELNSVFLMNSSEAIWQLMIPLPSSTNATPEGNNFILISAPTDVALSPFLLNSFEANDLRYTSWIGTYTTTHSPSITYYYPNKYKIRQAATSSEFTMVLRLAEQYLIRAEARARQGNLTAAASDLNVIRARAGLNAVSISIANSQSALLTAILHERQVELFTEWGHRWFDLIRTNSADSVMGRVTPLKGGTWPSDGHEKLYPVPQSERMLDVNLSQNAGY